MDPQSEALRFRLRMTRGVSFPHPFCHSRENGNPVVLIIPPAPLPPAQLFHSADNFIGLSLWSFPPPRRPFRVNSG